MGRTLLFLLLLNLSGAFGQSPQPQTEEAERKRRAYLSLFSSNVALSYRKPPANAPTETPLPVPGPLPSSPDASQIAQTLHGLARLVANGTTGAGDLRAEQIVEKLLGIEHSVPPGLPGRTGRFRTSKT